MEEVTAIRGWSNVSLLLPLYADDNGMVETLVFRFTNDGDMVNEERNYVGVGEFSLNGATEEELVYEKSLMISETPSQNFILFVLAK